MKSPVRIWVAAPDGTRYPARDDGFLLLLEENSGTKMEHTTFTNSMGSQGLYNHLKRKPSVALVFAGKLAVEGSEPKVEPRRGGISELRKLRFRWRSCFELTVLRRKTRVAHA